MKNIISAFIAIFCILNPCQAQTATAGVGALNFSMSERLPIGEIAVIEALAKSVGINVICGSTSTQRLFTTFQSLDNVKSIDDIKKVVERIYVNFAVNDPKEQINLNVYITDSLGKSLFTSNTSFKLEKVYNSLINNFVYQVPNYAGNLWFNLSDNEIQIPNVSVAHMLNRNGDIYQLNVVNGKVQIPGWMNNSGQFSELVIDGIRYDMNTGLILYSEIVKPNFLNVSFDKIQQVEYTTGLNVITVYPQYGYVVNTEIKVTHNHLQLQFQAGEWNWIYPISVRIATLNDLKPGGKGWTTYPYSIGMNLSVIPGTTYYVWPEYQDNVIGAAVSSGDKG